MHHKVSSSRKTGKGDECQDVNKERFIRVKLKYYLCPNQLSTNIDPFCGPTTCRNQVDLHHGYSTPAWAISTQPIWCRSFRGLSEGWDISLRKY